MALGWIVAAEGIAQRGAQDGQWPTYGGDLGSAKYAALDQINRDNVKDLKIVWQWEAPDNQVAAEDPRSRPGAFKVTPIMIKGVLYTSTSLGFVAAIDAATGQTLWVFDTESRKMGRPTNLGFNHRGVAYWTDGTEERIFMPSNDAFLWAIDAKTGKAAAGFGDNGRVDLTQGMRRPVERRLYTMISPPLVIRDRVIVGSSIFDGPTTPEMPPGDVRAFDPRTGQLIWTFHTVAQPGEFGNETWENGSWEYTGNTNVWTIMSGDEELGLVYLPISTPTNDWYGGHRLGDGLFAESLVCVKAETGERVWHYQLVHHGLWDYDNPAAPTLVDITVDGRKIKAVAQVTKQGFCYVFDRVTGQPVWPIEERPVPQSKVPGERTSPTQPFPTKPAPYESQGVTLDNIIDFTPELREEALKLLENYEWGPLFTPPSEKGTISNPGWGGGANWWGASFDPESGLLYVPSVTSPIVIQLGKPDPARSSFQFVRVGGMGMGPRGPQGLPLLKPPYGRITAIDLNTGDHAWMVPHGDGPRARISEVVGRDVGPVGGGGTGPVLTKTLLFIGQGGATSRGRGEEATSVLRAYDKATGEVIHAVSVPAPPAGTPMTYMWQGKQYIALAVGGGTNAGLIGLALP